MENEEKKETLQEKLEIQSTFNEDGLETLVEGDDCIVENQEEVDKDGN